MIKDDIITEIRWMSHIAPTWYSFLQILAEESKQRRFQLLIPSFPGWPSLDFQLPSLS